MTIMATSSEYSCGYCLTVKEEMSDACKLPCGHIFCLLCLLNDYQNAPKLKCISCRQEYENLDLMMLESCFVETKALLCDICDKTTKAEIFCTTCNKNMCKEHAEMHDSFNKKFGFNHITVSSHASKVKYTTGKHLCDIHNDEVKGACIECQSLVCFHCLADSKCPQSSGMIHTVVDVHKLSGSYKDCLNEKLSKLWSRKNDVEDLDKKANCLLAEEQTKCEGMKQRVDDVLQEQYTMMSEKARNMKLSVDSHCNGCENQVSLYTKNLGSIKEDIEHLCKEIHDVKQQSDYDIFLQFKKMLEKSEKILAAEMNPFKLDIIQEIYKFEQKEEIEKDMEVPNLLKLQLMEKEDDLKACRIHIEQLRKEKCELVARHEESEEQLKKAKEEMKTFVYKSQQIKKCEAELTMFKDKSQQLVKEKSTLEVRCEESAAKFKQAEAELKTFKDKSQQLEDRNKELKADYKVALTQMQDQMKLLEEIDVYMENLKEEEINKRRLREEESARRRLHEELQDWTRSEEEVLWCPVDQLVAMIKEMVLKASKIKRSPEEF